MRAILRAFRRSDRRQLSADDLRRSGVSKAALRAAVRAGRLRQGVTGYWIPAPADPGAVAIMRRAIEEEI